MLRGFAQPASAVVVGATGGIGRAVVAALLRDGGFGAVHAWSRRGPAAIDGALPAAVDITDEDAIRRAAGPLSAGPPLRLAIVATGLLHDGTVAPEKSWRQLDAERLVRSYRVNAVGPALVAKHLLPLLPKEGKAVFAALSARVGSIGDNRLGGWYGYRASKAGLNQLIRTLAIELARTRPDALCIGLHPGTVDTPLSRPFQGGVPAERLFDADRAARHLLAAIDAAGPADSGRVLAWDGSVVAP